MASTYNHGEEELKFKKWKENEEKEMRKSGMDEEDIHKIFLYDREIFNSDRRFNEKIDINSEEIINNKATKTYNSYADNLEDFLSSIESFALAETLSGADFRSQLIVFLFYRGYDAKEVAKITGLSVWSIYKILGNLKQTYFKYKNKKI